MSADYPTEDAYRAACEALEKHRARADAAEKEVKHLTVLERMAARHATKKDAEIAEADERVARVQARMAGVEAQVARQRLVLHDVRELADAFAESGDDVTAWRIREALGVERDVIPLKRSS